MILYRTEINNIKRLCIDGLQTDGAHHKQWYFEQILLCLSEDLDNLNSNESVWEKGVAP